MLAAALECGPFVVTLLPSLPSSLPLSVNALLSLSFCLCLCLCLYLSLGACFLTLPGLRCAGVLSNTTQQPDWVSAVAGAGEGLETFVTGCYDGCLRVYGPGCKVSRLFPFSTLLCFFLLHD